MTNIEHYLKKHPAAAEYRFLFDACRAVFAGTCIQYPDGIRSEVFLEIVQHHKLVPHLYPVLKNRCERVPSDVFARFQQLLKQHHLHILKLSGELARLSSLFTANELPWLSMKGPALSVQLYGDIAARQAHDIDILIETRDLEKATKVLTQAGYIAAYDPLAFNPAQVRFWRKYYKDACFTHVSKTIYVELHWRIVADRQMFNNINFFENIRWITVANQRIPVLDSVTNIIYLCYHGGYHAWRRLFWLWDMAEIIRTSSPEQLKRITDKMDCYGLIRIWGLTGLFANMLFGIEIPNPLKNIITSAKVTTLALRLMLRQNISPLKQMILNMHYHKLSLPPRDIKPVLAVALVNPLHWKTIRLPEKLFFLYYFLRPVAVVLRKFFKFRRNASSFFSSTCKNQ